MINICYVNVDVNKNVAAFTFPNIDSSMIKHILTVKSWTFTTWNNNSEMINYVQAKKDQNGFTVVETKYGIGFVPIFIKHLNGLGFILLNSDKTQFDLYEYCKEVNFPMLKYQLRDYQYSCSLKWDRDKLGVIKSPTGSGKTVMGCYIIKSSGFKTLILVHTIDLINVWKESLLRAFGNNFNNRIGIFGSGKSVEKALDVYNNIIIGTYQSAKQEKNLNALKKAGFGLIINDECIPADSILYTNYGKLSLSDCYKYRDKVQLKYVDNKVLNINESNFNIFKTKVQDVYNIKLENNKKIYSTINHKFLTKINNDISYQTLEQCKNIGFSLFIPYKTDNDLIKARLYGYMLSDGNLSKSMSSSFYGDHVDMLKIKEDLELMNYTVNKINTRYLRGEIKQENNLILNPEGSVTTLTVKSPFGYHMDSCGYPIGNKTNVNYEIPNWIMNGNLDIKKEFLASFLGAEGSVITPRLKRSFSTVKISYNKREDLVEKSMIFAEQLESLFNDLGVQISNIRILDGNIRKDNTKSKKIIFTIANNSESLYNYVKIGFRYCKRKEIKNEIILNYLNYIKNERTKRDILYNDTIELYQLYNSRIKVYRTLLSKQSIKNNEQLSLDRFDDKNFDDDKYVFSKQFNISEGMISDWIHPHKNKNNDMNICTQIPHNVISFEEWQKKVNNEIIFIDIDDIRYRSTEQCYNITVHNENHNYLLNGFVSKNCHHVPADTFKGVLNALMIPYKLGLSATPRRLDGREGDIFALVDSVKASVSIHELVKNKYVVKPEFYNIYWNDNSIVQKVANSNKNGLQKSLMLKKMSSTSHIKINLLIKLLKTFEKNNETFLLFADFVDAAIAIESIIQKFVTKYNENFIVTRVSQDMKSDERSAIFKQVGKKYQGIIFAKLGSEGIDISAVDNVIIMSPSKSPTTFAQRTGRAMRIAPGKNKCKVFQFVLNNSNEKNWSEFSFDEYRNEGFVQKNCILR